MLDLILYVSKAYLLGPLRTCLGKLCCSYISHRYYEGS